jgi:hypothetical protein
MGAQTAPGEGRKKKKKKKKKQTKTNNRAAKTKQIHTHKIQELLLTVFVVCSLGTFREAFACPRPALCLAKRVGGPVCRFAELRAEKSGTGQ